VGISVKIIQDFDSLLTIRKVWRSLVEKNQSLSVFALPEWHIAWWKSVGIDRTMYILVLEREGEVVGIVPLCMRRGGWDDLKTTLLEWSGGSQSDYQDLVADDRYINEVVLAIGPSFKELRQKVNVARFHNILSESKFANWIMAKQSTTLSTTPVPFLALGQKSYKQIASQWTRSHRGDVNRQRRRLEEKGALTLKVLSDPQEALVHLPGFFEAVEVRWMGNRMHSGNVLSNQHQQFFRELITSDGFSPHLHFSVLQLNEVVISYHFGFLYLGTLYYYRPAYVQDYAIFSPGKVHLSMLVELGCLREWKEIDLLGGGEHYKYLWAKEERDTVTIVVKGGKWWSAALLSWITIGKELRKTLTKRLVPLKRGLSS